MKSLIFPINCTVVTAFISVTIISLSAIIVKYPGSVSLQLDRGGGQVTINGSQPTLAK